MSAMQIRTALRSNHGLLLIDAVDRAGTEVVGFLALLLRRDVFK